MKKIYLHIHDPGRDDHSELHHGSTEIRRNPNTNLSVSQLLKTPNKEMIPKTPEWVKI